ncbi:MAG: ABC transporter ATP-binding protein/permease [Agathobacter sp.]|nr:ABC transporter ATP-binding protein/permease [Agathobacter sp.]
MMINTRLIKTVSGSKKYIAGNVLCQWGALAANITMMAAITSLLGRLLTEKVGVSFIVRTLLVCAIAILTRFVCTMGSSRMSYLSSKAVKQTLREKIYDKLLRIGNSHREQINTSEIVQVAVEGVEQLETYFGAYLPQFFYAMLAPLTLFVVLCFVNVPCALVLFLCVPLIPVTIVMVQRWAKKLLAKYWGQYTALGDTFLENLQGLTTLKIYQTDAQKHQEMNEQSEKFRKITMKVLTMQLNSITIMDLIAYGGAALGVILSVTQYRSGNITFSECLFIILISADFFIPMRLLGSYFHIAMNGMAASDKIFALLDLPEKEQGEKELTGTCEILCKALHFSYDKEREILRGIDISIPCGSFVAIVGESGCGKSTIASILTGKNKDYTGSVTIGGIELGQIKEQSLMKNITYVSHQNYLFKGTVRDNLCMGAPNTTEEQMWEALEKVKLADFLREESGLETTLTERASNLSGGQCQRLSLARALLHDSPVYIFDEATSNIDVESEDDIMAQIRALAKTKTVILISHRLANVTGADRIYVMDKGVVAEYGTQEILLEQNGVYRQLWDKQQELENYKRKEQTA